MVRISQDSRSIRRRPSATTAEALTGESVALAGDRVRIPLRSLARYVRNRTSESNAESISASSSRRSTRKSLAAQPASEFLNRMGLARGGRVGHEGLGEIKIWQRMDFVRLCDESHATFDARPLHCPP